MSYEQAGRIACEAVRIGAELVRTSTSVEVREKAERDYVTDVDLAVERELSAFLAERTPEHGFLGEEHGYREGAGEQECVWTLDPVDGTSNFARGLPLCAVSLALVRRGEPVVAAIACPFLDLEFSAIAGQGAYGGGERLRASGITDLSRALVSMGDFAAGDGSAEHNQRGLRLVAALADEVERVRMFGSAVLDLAWVASGRTAATVILSNNPWDTAAGVLLAREAGAHVFDASGRPHTADSAETIAVAPGISEDLLALVRRSVLPRGR